MYAVRIGPRPIRSISVVTILIALVLTSCGAKPLEDLPGRGWRLTRADLDVRIDPENERIQIEADLGLRFEAPVATYVLTLGVNTMDPNMRFREVLSPEVRDVELNLEWEAEEAARLAILRFSKPLAAGANVEVKARLENFDQGQLFILSEQFAFLSWVTGWFPMPAPPESADFLHGSKAPGVTRFHLPPGWRACSNGELAERREDAMATVETWNVPSPLSRGFVAGPYTVAKYPFGEREIAVYLLSAERERGKTEAETLLRAIRVMEGYYGPDPYPIRALAEAPEWVEGFYGVSEQDFIAAKSSGFDGPLGGLPLFGHEAAHAWWPTLIGVDGPGFIFLSESLAQYSTVLAIEKIHGQEAARDFLRFGTGGFSANHDARAYFRFLREGRDKPIIDITEGGGINHYLADSKGTWIHHMLRRRVGEGIFIDTFRDLIRRFSGKTLTLEQFREAFTRAAPDAKLDRFFEQWLERPGAPVLDLEWSLAGEGQVELAITQAQTGEPYHLNLDVALEAADGRSRTERLEIQDRETRFILPAPPGIKTVRLDPDHRLLVWTPDYGPKP